MRAAGPSPWAAALPIALLATCALPLALGFYLPGVAPIDYSVGDKLRPKVAPSPRPPSHSNVSAIKGPLLSGAACLGLLELTYNPVQVEALTSVRTQLPCAPAPAAPPPCLSHSPSPQV